MALIIQILNKITRILYGIFHLKLVIKIGSNVSINTGCVLQCYGGITIGNNVTISDGAKILTRSLELKNYLDNKMQSKRKHIDNKVIIGDGVWIAANAIILPGVTIAPGCVIGAGSVVSNNLIEKECVYAGNPAKKIRKF